MAAIGSTAVMRRCGTRARCLRHRTRRAALPQAAQGGPSHGLPPLSCCKCEVSYAFPPEQPFNFPSAPTAMLRSAPGAAKRRMMTLQCLRPLLPAVTPKPSGSSGQGTEPFGAPSDCIVARGMSSSGSRGAISLPIDLSVNHFLGASHIIQNFLG